MSPNTRLHYATLNGYYYSFITRGQRDTWMSTRPGSDVCTKREVTEANAVAQLSVDRNDSSVHVTHTGRLIRGRLLDRARATVADAWAANARAVRNGPSYAAHVTDEDKDLDLNKELAFADRIRSGDERGFTVWQRVNEELTGVCVSFLPPPRRSVSSTER